MKRTFTLVTLLFAGMTITAQNASEFPCTVVNDHSELLLEMVKTTPGFTPPVAARAFGYVGLTLYESIQPGMPASQSFSGLLNELENVPQPENAAILHWPTVANNAMATVVAELFSNTSEDNLLGLQSIKDTYNAQYSASISAESFSESVAYGELVANHIFSYSMTDGGYNCQLYNFPEDFVPVTGPGMWVPLQGQMALHPYWGSNRAFVAANNDPAILPTYLPDFSTDESSDFYAYAFETYEAVNNATTDQIHIAQWWADGPNTITPPGHSISLMAQTLEETEAKLDEAALVYSLLGMSLSDAFLACWEVKYIENVIRPVSYIHEHIDSEWNTIVGTPPFPEYVSGHSSQSGAMGTIMTHFFGDDYAFTDNTYAGEIGDARSFDSFWDAANEAAVSRLYGGIHYAFSNDEGLYLGERVAENFLSLFNAVGTGDHLTAAPEILAYPNPTNSTVFFGNLRTAVSNVELYNSLGARVYTASNVEQLDLSGLPAGTYLMSYQLTADAVKGHKRIVKL